MESSRSAHIVQTPTKLGSHGKNKLFTDYEIIEDKLEKGKHGEVFFVETPNKTHKLALKRQIVQEKDVIRDRSYREFRILEELGKLKTDTFVCLVDWFKIHPPLLPDDSDEEGDEEYFHLVLEYVEQTLRSRIKEGPLSIQEFKSILFEILFALHIAQRELEFNHNDLHHRNILLTKLEPGTYRTHEDGPHKWYTTGYAVKLCDFGLSRITIKETGEIISSDKYSSFLPNADVDQLATGLKSVKVNWEDSNEQSLFKNLKKMMSEGHSPEKLIWHDFFNSLQTPREKARTYKPPALKKSLKFSPVTIKKLQKGAKDPDSLIDQMEALSLHENSKLKVPNNSSLSDITNTKSKEIKKSNIDETKTRPVTRSSKEKAEAELTASKQPPARKKSTRATKGEW